VGEDNRLPLILLHPSSFILHPSPLTFGMNEKEVHTKEKNLKISKNISCSNGLYDFRKISA